MIALRFGLLSAQGTIPGGTAVFIVTADGTADEDRALTGQWLGLAGGPILSLNAGTWAPGATLIDLIPRGLASPGFLVQMNDGTVQYREGIQLTSVDPTRSVDMALLQDGRGHIRVRTLKADDRNLVLSRVLSKEPAK